VTTPPASDEPCDFMDDVQAHHDYSYEQHGAPLGICRRCGRLSPAWEE
jgi:hypothetical protein